MCGVLRENEMVAKQTQSSKMKRRFAWPLAIAMGLTTTVATANDEEGGDPPPPPPADLPSSGLSESETSYTGAVMLRGNLFVGSDLLETFRTPA